MDVAVTGSSGLIGTALRAALERAGHRVLRMVRSQPAATAGEADALHWDPATGAIDAGGLEGIGAVVNLAGGSSVAKRWNTTQKARFRDSRVNSTTLLAETLAKLANPPGVLLSASAVGIYGDRGDEILTEESRPGDGFLADLGRAWETATEPAQQAGIRVTHLRTAMVLAGHGGGLQNLLPLFKLGLGGKLGSGSQWMSWIALEDEAGAIVHLLSDDAPAGPVNLTAPNPATNADFTKALGRALGRPTVVRVPAAGLRLLLGSEMADEVILGGQRALPTRLLDSGYAFAQPDLDSALGAALARPSHR